MTPEQEHIFCQAAQMGIACGLAHWYEWYINADRALMHGPYTEIEEKSHALLNAFIAFEKETAGCFEEAEELKQLTHRKYIERVNEHYRKARERNEAQQLAKAINEGIADQQE